MLLVTSSTSSPSMTWMLMLYARFLLLCPFPPTSSTAIGHTRIIFAHHGQPPPNAFPLGLCEGHCKDDTECQEGLFCFQRDPNEPIPGCLGGETDTRQISYCTDVRRVENASSEANASMPMQSNLRSTTRLRATAPSNPTSATRVLIDQNSLLPPSNPTAVPRQIYAYFGRPPANAFPLGLCKGDCKDDSECQEGLYCFQRGPNTPVPGCIGGEKDRSRTDYCTDTAPQAPMTSPPPPTRPPISTASPTAPPQATTRFPTFSPETGSTVVSTSSPVSKPTPTPGYIYSYPGGPPAGAYPLGQCQGDCKWHEDCGAGMFCFQRDPYEPVPGCIGGDKDRTTTDYCTYSAPVVAPVQPPTADDFRIKMYWDNYYWQEESFDRVWCMQCKNGCQEGEILFLHYCAWDSARFDFVDAPSNQVQIRVVDTNLCLERSGNATSLKVCNLDNPLQHWKSPTGGFGGAIFEFIQTYDGEDYCVTQHHHPKYGEIIEMYTCNEARFDTTSYWMKY
jgi:hypothetical protein